MRRALRLGVINTPAAYAACLRWDSLISGIISKVEQMACHRTLLVARALLMLGYAKSGPGRHNG